MNSLKSEPSAFSMRYASIVTPLAYLQAYVDLDVSDFLYSFLPILQEYFKKDNLNFSLGCGYSEKNRLEFYPQIAYNINNVFLVAEIRNIIKRKDLLSMVSVMLRKNINIKDQCFLASLKYNPGLGQFTVFFQHSSLSFMDGAIKLSVGLQQPKSAFNISRLFENTKSQAEEVRQMNLGHLTGEASFATLSNIPSLLLSEKTEALLILGDSGTGKSVLSNNYIPNFCKENNLHYAKIELANTNTGGYVGRDLFDYINQILGEADNFWAACRTVFCSSEIIKIMTANSDTLRAEVSKTLLSFIDGGLEGLHYKGIPITKKDSKFKFIFDDSCTDALSGFSPADGYYYDAVKEARKNVRNWIEANHTSSIWDHLFQEWHGKSTEMFIYRVLNSVYGGSSNIKDAFALASYDPNAMISVIKKRCRGSDLIRRFDVVVLAGVPLDLHALYSFEDNRKGFPINASEEQIKLSLVASAFSEKFQNTREIIRCARKLIKLGEKLNPCPVNNQQFIAWEDALANYNNNIKKVSIDGETIKEMTIDMVKRSVISNQFFAFSSKIYPLDAFLTACAEVIEDATEHPSHEGAVHLEALYPEFFANFDYSLISDISISQVQKYKHLLANQDAQGGVIFEGNKLKALEELVLYRDKKQQKEKDISEKQYNDDLLYLRSKGFKKCDNQDSKAWFAKISHLMTAKSEYSYDQLGKDVEILLEKIKSLTDSKTEYNKHNQLYEAQLERDIKNAQDINDEEFSKLKSNVEQSKAKYLNDKATLKSFIDNLENKCSKMQDYDHHRDRPGLKKNQIIQRREEYKKKIILTGIIKNANAIFDYLEHKKVFEENNFLDILYFFNGLSDDNTQNTTQDQQGVTIPTEAAAESRESEVITSATEINDSESQGETPAQSTENTKET